jgi:hypothetical protein
VGYLRGLYLGREADPRVETLWSKLNHSLPEMDSSLSGIHMEEGAYHYIPRVIRNGIGLELTELSDGYQAILVIVLDLMLRYAYRFSRVIRWMEGPWLGSTRSTFICTRDGRGLYCHN